MFQNTAELFRILILTFLSFVIAMLGVPVMTKILYKYQFWKKPKEETLYGTKATEFQKLHAGKHKRNIPTMAGVWFWMVVAIISLVFNFTRSQTWLPLFSLVGIGIIGAIDDWFNIRGIGGVKGIRVWQKLIWLIAVALAGALWFYYKLGFHILHFPGINGDFNLGIWYIVLFVFVIIASANAYNIVDGLDGLSGGIFTTSFGAYGILALANGQTSLAIFCFTVVGALLAYLWFNIYPARFFGGDTYSLAFGATLGVVAALIPNGVGIVVLPIIAIVPLIDTLSDIVQLFWRKAFKKKLFRIAPIHHHFEAIGWEETKVTMRAWIISAVFAALGVAIGIAGMGVR